MIKIVKNMKIEERNRAIDFALYCGFKSVNATFPVVSFTEGEPVPNSVEDFPLACKNVTGEGNQSHMISSLSEDLPEDYVAATDSAVELADFDWRKKKGLESIFTAGMLLEDENLDLLPDSIVGRFVLAHDASDEMVMAACNLAFRLGMETTAYEGNLVAQPDYEGAGIYFVDSIVRANELGEDGKCDTAKEHISGSMKLVDRTSCKVKFLGHGEALVSLSNYICEQFPVLGNGRTWTDALQDMTNSFLMKNMDGQVASLEVATRLGFDNIEAWVEKEDTRIEEIKKLYPKAQVRSYKEQQLIYEDTYDIKWEVDTYKDLLERHVYPKVKLGDKVELYAALSEEQPLREELVKECKEKISKLGGVLTTEQLLCGYKQGISWIQEVVLPRITSLEQDMKENPHFHVDGNKIGYTTAKKVIIAFKPFLPEGEASWGDESGVVPSYANGGNDDENGWYDLPIRFLQELYPVEDILVDALGISRENVVFVVADEAQEETYNITVTGEDDQEIYSETYDVQVWERPYMSEYPAKGKVHPCTGYVKVLVNGEVILDERVASDVEMIWDVYQNEVLPKCKAYIDDKVELPLSLDQQPFFARLNMDITASEPDYRLNSREDLISTLDGLHEDMYFFAADYLRQYGIDKNDLALDAPGLILPVIRKGEGKPKFIVSMYDQLATTPIIKQNGELFRTIDPEATDEENLYVEELLWNDGAVTVGIRADLTCGNFIRSYNKLLDEDKLEVCELFSGIKGIEIRHKEYVFEANVCEKLDQVKDLAITDIDLCERQLIGYDQHIAIIEQLKRVPGIGVNRIARSYMGRDLYAIELLPDLAGYVSRVKRLSSAPSLYINARHHANEVSGTNGAYMLLKELLVNPKYKGIGNALNLVIVPLENVDGTAIHYELQKENPHWKLHVARFNAIGKEFYYEHFKKDTIHTEAHGLTHTWHKYLPDIMVDNHGVPSHEWEQQFSGYTAPAYKGFWLPRSLLYGYFWTVNGEEFKSNFKVNKAMEDVIAEKMRNNPEVGALNKEWMGQFGKFANSWMPKLFPAEYYKDMINYWIPFDFDVNHRYPSIKFPWITTVAYTSEVADETAQGDYLNLCGRAHFDHDIATIDMLLESKVVMRRTSKMNEGVIKVEDTRLRPMIINDTLEC